VQGKEKIGKTRQEQTQTPWCESASELYRPSDRHLSAKLVLNFADRGCYIVSVTHSYGPAPTLGSWVRIPLAHGCLCVFCVRIISELKLLIKKLNMNSLKLAEWAP
jgi:hypothetical protein